MDGGYADWSDGDLLDVLRHSRGWLLSLVRQGVRPYRSNRAVTRLIRRECRRRGLCTKAARPVRP